MNYIELINNFWKLDEGWQFTPVETRLYFYLVKTANSFGWVDEFQHKDDKAACNVGVSLNTLKTARNRITQAGLITFKAGGNGHAEKTRYQILTPNMQPKLYPNPQPKAPPNPQPYNTIKEKKTKLLIETGKKSFEKPFEELGCKPPEKIPGIKDPVLTDTEYHQTEQVFCGWFGLIRAALKKETVQHYFRLFALNHQDDNSHHDRAGFVRYFRNHARTMHSSKTPYDFTNPPPDEGGNGANGHDKARQEHEQRLAELVKQKKRNDE